MNLHILGICGTFMGGIAILASQLKHKVSGSDSNVYPPMSTQLESQGIKLIEGFGPEQLDFCDTPFDEIVVGNVMTRGVPVIEELLNRGLTMTSGPEWLARHVLSKRHVLAVSGTHGKTTTASMLAWILEFAGMKPGFLIGGIPNNFGISARLGESQYFVVEADEYDSAFFDKRSKFIHYRPRTLIINNLEFDHADIFPNLSAIQTQFHHLIRTVPNHGLMVVPEKDEAVFEVLHQGCWTPLVTFANTNETDVSSSTSSNAPNFKAKIINELNHFLVISRGIDSDSGSACASDFAFAHASVSHSPSASETHHGSEIHHGIVQWNLLGQHNVSNALAAIAAAQHVGVNPELAVAALSQFQGVKRRLEIKGVINNITVYDDFAHHPTAIKVTLEGLRSKLGHRANIIAIVDIRSNTMKAGHHKEKLPGSFKEANSVYFFQSPDITWNVPEVWQDTQKPGGVFADKKQLLKSLFTQVKEFDHVVFMSNGGFGGIHSEFIDGLK